MDARPSEHFTWEELTRSAKAAELGIANQPTASEAYALGMLCALVLEPARSLAGGPLQITSGFRSRALNEAIGGAKRSDHMRGEAADVRAEGITSRDLAGALWRVRHMLPIKQCIWYAPERGGHLHLSIDLAAIGRGEAPRRQWLFAPAGGGYQPWQP